ncbi:MAG TPA: DUF721 domain-containing protein [Fimbriimonadaceae bacterium]|jgi:predicted nucleic acid-binding Zn ribbon protein
MKKLGSLVPEAIGREEVLKASHANRILKRWPEIVGPLLASKSTPDKYDNGTVWVAVTGSEWAQELRMMKNPILAKLRSFSSDPQLFTDIRYGVRAVVAVEAVVEMPEHDRKAYQDELRELSIQEIRERRLKKLGQ